LIQIGSKTAEKNSAQTNKQTDRQTDKHYENNGHLAVNQLLSSNISSRCPHNMVNFGPLAAEIGPAVWGIPANFNRFYVLAALLHGTPAVGVSQTLQR